MKTAILLEPKPWEEAAAFLRDKPVVAQRAFKAMVPELRARAFTVAGIESANVLRDIRDAIATLPQGARWDDVKKDVLARMGAHAPVDGDPDAREQAVKRAARHAELVMRSNGFTCAAAAQHRALEGLHDVFPAWRYNAFGDSKTRPTHAALDGLVLRADDPFWAEHTPPWEWGCRCWLTPATTEDLAAARAGRDGWSAGPVALKQAGATGMLAKPDGHPVDIRSPRRRAKEEKRDPNKEWWFNPGDLRVPLETLRSRYDEETWGGFHRAMVASWMDRADGGRRRVWDWALEPALNDARAVALAFGAATKREMLVAVDYRTGRTLKVTKGTARGVNPEWALAAARQAGTKAVLVHNHPSGQTLSPKDVRTMVLNRDAVEAIEAGAPQFRYRARIRQGNDRPDLLLPELNRFADLQDARKLDAGEWEAFLRRQDYIGVLRYERAAET